MPNTRNTQNTRNTHIQSTLGRNLMMLRKSLSLTQEKVADILKIKRSTYAYYERDITPTLDNIKKLATLFDVSVHYLLFGEEESPDVPWNAPLGTEHDLERMKLRDLKKDESLLIRNYRLLSPQNKEKIYKETKDLADKSN